MFIVVASIIVTGAFLSFKSNDQISQYLLLTDDGQLSIDNDSQDYKLLASSRLGFLGCWLELQPIKVSATPSKMKNKHLFIFRDSLNGQDFSRLVRVVKQLH